MSVTFEELEGSPSIRFDDGRFAATRRLLVAWSDWLDLALELYGSYRQVGGGFSYTPPATFPGVPGAIVTRLTVEGFPPDRPLSPQGGGGVGEQMNAYAKALVTAGYTIPFDLVAASARGDLPAVPQGTYLSYAADLGGEHLSLPGRGWIWHVDGEPVDDDVPLGMMVPIEEVRLTWRRVPLPPWDAIRDLRGKLNAGPFLGHATGTVLFVGARTARDFQLVDGGLWRLDYHFQVREVESTATPNLKRGWNYFYRTETSPLEPDEHWLEIRAADVPTPPYAAGDFGGLFQFGGG